MQDPAAQAGVAQLLGCGAGTAAQLAPASPDQEPSDVEDGVARLAPPRGVGWGQLPIERIAAGPTFVLALLAHPPSAADRRGVFAWGDARVLTGGSRQGLWQVSRWAAGGKGGRGREPKSASELCPPILVKGEEPAGDFLLCPDALFISVRVSVRAFYSSGIGKLSSSFKM